MTPPNVYSDLNHVMKHANKLQTPKGDMPNQVLYV